MTRFDVRAATAALGLGLVLASGAAAHEDDPKILDRKAPFPGTGYTAANHSLAGGGTAASALGFPADRLSLNAWLTLSDLGNGSQNGSDCWGYVSPSGREYALMCTTGATVVVEVTNPQNPQVIGRINGPNSTWRDVKTYQNRAYTVSEGGSGIQVINLPGAGAAVSGPVEQVIPVAGGQIYAGLRDDPFFFDLEGFTDTVTTGVLSFDSTRDSLAGTNVTSIVLEMDLGAATKGSESLQIWATSNRL